MPSLQTGRYAPNINSRPALLNPSNGSKLNTDVYHMRREILPVAPAAGWSLTVEVRQVRTASLAYNGIKTTKSSEPEVACA